MAVLGRVERGMEMGKLGEVISEACGAPYQPPQGGPVNCIKVAYHGGRHLGTRGTGSSKAEFTWPK